MMSIEMSGCVYCPLSSRDPEHRLHSLIEQTESRLALVHCLTSRLLNRNIVRVDIDSVSNNNYIDSSFDGDQLHSVIVIPDSIAYIIFTSGSTGAPKAVSNKEKINFYHTIVLFVDRCKFDTEILLNVCSLWFS